MIVIIPCYILNEDILSLTKEAVYSLGDVDILMVDNGSEIGGGFLRAVSRIYIRNKRNLGYAKAVNQGLKLVNDEYIAIANNDIRVSPNWQKTAKEVLSEPKTYSCHFRMTNYDVPFEYGRRVVYKGMERWCTSSFFVIRSKQPFLYDEHYFNSYDDWDYWTNVKNKGLNTAYTDKACYQHNHSYTKRVMDWDINDNENKEYFKKKWGKYPDDLYKDLYPDQMDKDYLSGFNL